MCSLNKQQVTVIVSDVERASITFSHLIEDLIDHICCEVENEMRLGKSFEQAYETVKQQTGINVLQKIQENTRYLIDKNFRIMKKTMKISGLISMALLGLATVFKIFHWPGASVGMVLGFFILCVLFFPSAIYVHYKDVKQKSNFLLHLSVLIGGIAFMVGVLFKVMHWPGASITLLLGWGVLLGIFLPLLLISLIRSSSSSKEKRIYTIGIIALILFEMATAFKMFHWPGAGPLMIVGSVLLISVFLPMFTYHKYKETGKITGQYIFLIITSMFFILFTFLLVMNVSKDVLGVFTINNSNNKMLSNYIEQKNDPLLVNFKNLPDSVKLKIEPEISSIRNSSKELCEFINDIKIQIIQSAENTDKTSAQELANNPELISAKDNYEIVTKIMYGDKINGDDGLAKILKEKIEKFKANLISLQLNNPEVLKFINSSLDTSYDVTYNGVNLNWEFYNFYHIMLIIAINYLSELEINIRTAESEAIKSILVQNTNL